MMSSGEKRIDVLIVDDEPPALRGLARLVASRPAFRVLGQCPDARSALRQIELSSPDLILLDVQMPGLDGFGLTRSLDKSNRPAIIFVTAHDQFALAAFETHAIDYLLKPYSERRLDEALAHAKTVIDSKRIAERARLPSTTAVERGSKHRSAPLERVVVKSIGRTEVVPVADIVRIEASGYCVRLFTRDRIFVHRESMRSLEGRLPQDAFVRVHRSRFVNVAHIRGAAVLASGLHELTLQDASKHRVSRSRWKRVQTLLTSWTGRQP